jgi:hypothetical protein
MGAPSTLPPVTTAWPNRGTEIDREHSGAIHCGSLVLAYD